MSLNKANGHTHWSKNTAIQSLSLRKEQQQQKDKSQEYLSKFVQNKSNNMHLQFSTFLYPSF